MAEFWSLSLEALRARIVDASLASDAELDADRALLADPDFHDLSPGPIGAWGRKPRA